MAIDIEQCRIVVRAYGQGQGQEQGQIFSQLIRSEINNLTD